jgi:hypothetical protein
MAVRIAALLMLGALWGCASDLSVESELRRRRRDAGRVATDAGSPPSISDASTLDGALPSDAGPAPSPDAARAADAASSSCVPTCERAFYVREGASGDRSGTDWANAYPALPATLVRGGTYYVADGTYGGYTFDDPEAGTETISIRKATDAAHGTSAGWSPTYGDGEAVFSGSGTVWTFDTGLYDLDGVVGRGRAPGSYGFRVRSSASRSGTTVMVLFRGDDVSSVSFRHVDFDWDNGTSSGTSGVTRHLYTEGASDHITIESSYFHHSSGFVFYVGPYDPSPTGPLQSHYTIRDNYFYMNGGGGGPAAHWETMWLMNLDDSTIDHNVIEDTIGESGQTGWVMLAKSDRVDIHGNLFFCSDPRCIVGGNGVVATWSSDSYVNSSIHIYGNTFVDLVGVYTPKILFVHSSADDRDIRVGNNLYFNTEFAWGGIDVHHHETCGGGQGCAGTSAETGLASSRFVDYAGDEFRLSVATAPGDATIGERFAVDLDGRPRGADGVWDRGAYEHLATP